MARVKRGVTAHAKHKKVLEQAKGFSGRRKNTIRTAKAAVDKAGQYAYRDRKVRKRSFRSLWIQRINAAAREEGMTYSVFSHGLELAGIDICRTSPATTRPPSRLSPNRFAPPWAEEETELTSSTLFHETPWRKPSGGFSLPPLPRPRSRGKII
jgi:large subunit ribosomal protein L20